MARRRDGVPGEGGAAEGVLEVVSGDLAGAGILGEAVERVPVVVDEHRADAVELLDRDGRSSAARRRRDRPATTASGDDEGGRRGSRDECDAGLDGFSCSMGTCTSRRPALVTTSTAETSASGIAVAPVTSAVPRYVACQVAATSLRPSWPSTTRRQRSPGVTPRRRSVSAVPEGRAATSTAARTPEPASCAAA
jgi:hypothetical protein